MIIDAQHLFSENQALSGAGNINSTNEIDFGANNRRIGDGESMVVVVTVDVAAGGTTPTLQIQLFLDNTNGRTTQVAASATLAAAQLTRGARFFVPVPQGLGGRFLGVRYVLGGTTPTVTVTATLTTDDMLQNEAVYPSGYTVN